MNLAQMTFIVLALIVILGGPLLYLLRRREGQGSFGALAVILLFGLVLIVLAAIQD